MAALYQLRLLLWKSFKVALRSPIYTILEIALPLIVLNILRYARDKLDVHILPVDAQAPRASLLINPGDSFHYSCDSAQCAMINENMRNICGKYGCKMSSQRSEYSPYFHFNSFTRTTLSVSMFASSPLESPALETKPSFNDFSVRRDDEWLHTELESLLGAFAREATNLSTPILFGKLGSPQREKAVVPVLLHFQEVLLALMLVPMLAAINVAREMAVEKESSMKEYLLVMGMTRATYYAHHVIWALLKSLPAIVGVSAMSIKDSPVLGSHFLLAFLLFVTAQIALATVIPAIVTRPTIATLFAFVLIPFNSLLALNLPVTRTSILLSSLASLNPGHAMSLAFDTIKEALYRENNLLWFADAKYALTYGGVIIIMLFDIVLYVSLAMAIDIIGSSTENIFARFKKAIATEDDDDGIELNVHEQDETSEKAVVDVELCNVYKTYPSGEQAVRGVSMKLLRGQITVLLGHNGAGKSTTFAMIAGITVPTAGTIRIGEHCSKADRRSMIGYCPQYNPIFPKLTVSEHLRFFAALKGISEHESEGERLLQLLLLEEKAKKRASSLSGGMKRKLSIAIALIGNSKVVLLDEPTAGVDAGARRDIERLLAAQKRERTFLLTTHYTDEAEHLGDRILIMAGGKLVCSGSPHFLHREFGAGYILSCVARGALAATAQSTLEFAQKVVGGAKLERQHGQQFEIWLDKERSESFPSFFAVLDEYKDELGIDSYFLSNNTLEQVFLRVGELTGVAKQAKVKEALGVLLKENVNRCSGTISYLQRFAFLQYKRLLYEFCEIKSVLINLLPLILAIYGFYSVSSMLRDKAMGKGLPFTEQSLDPLEFSACFRIGVEKSLKISDALKSSLPSGSCILVEDADDAQEWFTQTAMARRPPILATIGKLKIPGGIGVSMARNALFNTIPLHLSLIRALTNSSFTVTALYMRRRPAEYGNRVPIKEVVKKVDETILSVAVGVFMLLQPIMMYRSSGFYVVERTIKFTHQQLLTGLPRWLYGMTSFCSDLAHFLINYGFTVLCCAYFDVLTGELWRLTPLCLLIFFISQVKCYIFQRVFESKSKAENLAFMLLTVSYIAFGTAFMSLQIKKAVDMKEELELITELSKYYDLLSRFDIDYDYPLLLDPQVAVLVSYAYWVSMPGGIYIALLLQLAVVLLVFALLELLPHLLRVVDRRRRQSSQVSGATSAPLLENGNCPVLEVTDLVKKYGKNIAVNNISFSVDQHECFGLLGVNGAGKTSTFEVLTGSAAATSGSATVAGVDCATPARIGYCPQFDALMQELGGRQNLMILAALHGYRNPTVVADTVIECVGMSAHANKRTKSYSGGQRRKISVAAALLAQNSLIILDEPTAGIDPVTRRDIWSVICALRDSTDTAIVLTSHSMEEVEALCSRLAILRAGEIAAQGTSQSLKSAYGNNFKLTLVVDGKSDQEVLDEVQKLFGAARKINGASESVYIFEIPRKSTDSWEKMFLEAIKVRKRLDARDYSLSQASLEDAFIALNNGSASLL